MSFETLLLKFEKEYADLINFSNTLSQYQQLTVTK